MVRTVIDHGLFLFQVMDVSLARLSFNAIDLRGRSGFPDRGEKLILDDPVHNVAECVRNRPRFAFFVTNCVRFVFFLSGKIKTAVINWSCNYLSV